jgi:UDP-N-acetylglucosamine 2-epimerase
MKDLMNLHKLLIIIGTRPELIKVAPVIMELKKRNIFNYKIVNTGQHKELLDPYWKVFDITPDYDLNIISPNQDLARLTSRALLSINDLIKELHNKGEKPLYILAQGDTTTVMASSVAAFYNNIMFLHLEAGLRSYNLQHPYPEEFNRRIAGIVADIHFSPTKSAKNNLIREGIIESKIEVVGNTVVDALNYITNSDRFTKVIFSDHRINDCIGKGKQVVLITVHRRENQNKNLENLIFALKKLCTDNPDICFIWPVHSNPKVKLPVLNSDLSKLSNVILTDPLSYLELLKLISLSKIIFTDSGGIQEEAPSFKKPVLILREVTERPEAVDLGLSRLVGCDPDLIINEFYNFHPDYRNIPNPYGDGCAAERIVNAYLKKDSILFKS